MQKPFSVDGRDFYVDKDGKLWSVDEGYDAVNAYPDWVPATQDQYDKRQDEKDAQAEHDAKPLTQRIAEGTEAFAQGVARKPMMAAEALGETFGEDNEPFVPPEGDAPPLYERGAT